MLLREQINTFIYFVATYGDQNNISRNYKNRGIYWSFISRNFRNSSKVSVTHNLKETLKNCHPLGSFCLKTWILFYGFFFFLKHLTEMLRVICSKIHSKIYSQVLFKIRSNKYNIAKQLQIWNTIATQQHKYNTATQIQYGDTNTIWRHKFNMATQM